ncbi:lysylphosphatidylglycerol synthase domain-containing protein [Miltoncostaea marina]|uniref:lysylphosphatidylglycerol synthase domain-containing protein n=1 Tax=Miltoncostaea marina TaxID=2843215 RepID=UPI001C3DA9BC|nr:lysylphosphatidylglycerol synthase domain-containing protein [Miltoncostaea marina]
MVIGVAAAAILGFGTLTLVGRVADFGRIEEAWDRAELGWLALCPAGLVLAYAGYVAGYRDMARADRGPVLAPGVTMRVVAVGFGAVALGSGPGGLAVDFWALRRAGAGLHEAARRVLGFNTLEWAILGVGAALAGALALSGLAGDVPTAMAATWLAVVPLCVALGMLVSSPRAAARLSRVDPARRRHGLHGVALRRPGTWLPWVADKLRVAFADSVGGLVLVRHVVRRPVRYRWGIAGFGLYWLGQLTIVQGAILAFEEHLNPVALVLAFATGYAATALPLPGGGAGGVEASMAFALHATGVSLEAAVLAVFTFRVVSFWVPIVPAMFVATSIPRLHEELLPATPRQSW